MPLEMPACGVIRYFMAKVKGKTKLKTFKNEIITVS